MSKTKWYTRAIYLAVALAMTVGLLMVPAVGATNDAETGVNVASPTEVCGCVGTCTGGTAGWLAAQTHVGDYTPKLYKDGNGGACSTYVEFVPDTGTTLADLGAATATPEWSWWHKTSAVLGNHSQMELRFTQPGGDPDIVLDVTAMPLQNYLGTDLWVEQPLVQATPGLLYYGTDAAANGYSWEVAGGGDGILKTVAGIVAAIEANGTCTDTAAVLEALVLTRVRIELWEGGPVRTSYVDDVTIDGTTYDLEPCYYLDPDIAYNVKTADETFTVMDECVGGPVDGTLVTSWVVTKGCGAGVVSVVDGGDAGDNFITVRMVVKGDCNITAVVNGVVVKAEKKWGEIYCTDLAKDSVDEFFVTETVKASFLWNDCVKEVELLADDAVVNWWLMDIGALADVQALEAALGDDPCDPDGGCGTYGPDFFTYDKTDYDNPSDVLDDIQADNSVDPVESYIFESNGVVIPDTDYTWNQTDEDGEATVEIYTESPTGVILVTLADYPIDKHGENTVCVQHETWPPPPPPPALEKLPLIAWVGEKTVVEWNLGVDYIDQLVTFASERPYSIGVLESIPEDLGPQMGEVVTTTVTSDGIARVIVHSDKSGKTNIVARVGGMPFPADLGSPAGFVTPPVQQGFIVYWLALESVELVNIEDGDLPNPAWDTEGVTQETLDIGDTTTLRVRVRGYFVDPDPEFQSTRSQGWLDSDGDGIADVRLPEGRWILPDDWYRLAGGALWELQKPHWDIMDDLDDPTCPVWSELDANGDYDEEMGDYDDDWTPMCVNSPDENAAYPVIGPLSTAQPCTPDQWDTDPAAVIADGEVIGCLRTTAVPDYRCDLFDAVMPPVRVYLVADSGSLSTTDKGDIYYGTYEGDTYYTFPYYRQEIPSSWEFDPYYGEGPAGYKWDSWDLVADAPESVKGPYDFYEALPLWDYDYDAINDVFGYGIGPDDDQLVEVYTDNHGEAYADFTLEWIGESTINAIACYPFLVGDFNSVVSNPVTKQTENKKDIKIAWEKVDSMTDMLYVFVRDYDGTPATEDLVDFTRDGVNGTIVDLLDGVTDTIAPDGSSAMDVTTRVMTAAEEDTFADAEVTVPLDRFHREIVETGELLFDPDATIPEYPEDYAITGIEVISSLGYPVDIVITIHDIFGGEPVEDFNEDQILYFHTTEENNPAVEDGLASILDELVMVYNFDNATQTWSWYNPTWPADANTLDTLYQNKAYWVKVSANCTLVYGTQSQQLFTGWNNIPWLGF